MLLIAFTSLCSWLSGIWIEKIRSKTGDEGVTKRKCQWVAGGNIVLNLAILGFFKYYNSNMFIENFSLEESNKYLIDIFKSRIKSGRNIYITTDNIKSFEDIANIL